MCACMCPCAHAMHLLVPELVGDGEGQRQARVLTDAAAAVGLTHACHMRQAQGLTWLIDGCTDVLSEERRERKREGEGEGRREREREEKGGERERRRGQRERRTETL